jgi:hypothetical protein
MTCTGCVFLATDNRWCAKLKRNVSGERCMHHTPRAVAQAVKGVLEAYAGDVVRQMNEASE